MESLIVVPSVAALTVSALLVWATRLRADTAHRAHWQKLGCAALAACAYSALELGRVLRDSGPPELFPWFARLQFTSASAWLFFATALHSRVPLWPTSKPRLSLTAVLALGAALALVPGALLSDTLHEIQLPALNRSYAVATPTGLGSAYAGFLLVVVLGLFTEALTRWQRREPGAQGDVASLGLLLAAGVSDTLTMIGLGGLPPVLAVGFSAHGIAALSSTVRREVAAGQALEQLNQQLEAKVAVRSAELARVKEEKVRNEKLAALGRLSAGVAHEINNPAGVALSSLQYLQRELGSGGAPPPDAREALADGVAAIERIARIVQQLQESGRSAAAAPPELSAVSVREAVEQALTLATAGRAPGVSVANEVAADVWVMGQQRLLQQALLNLVLNAQRAAAQSDASPRVRVSARHLEGRVSIAVEDNGPGVPSELVPQLFEPFFSTTAVGEGMGLGLAIALNLAQTMRGQLTLVSSRAGETIFRLTLEEAEAPAVPPARPTPFPPRARPQVLVIDDDPLVARAIARQVGGRYEACLAETVAEALALLETHPGRFSAVLCDLMMPDGGAATFLPEVRKRWPAVESRTLFVTGGTTTDAADQFHDANFANVLTKPIDTQKLLAALDAVTGAAPPEAGSPEGSTGHAQ